METLFLAMAGLQSKRTVGGMVRSLFGREMSSVDISTMHPTGCQNEISSRIWAELCRTKRWTSHPCACAALHTPSSFRRAEVVAVDWKYNKVSMRILYHGDPAMCKRVLRK